MKRVISFIKFVFVLMLLGTVALALLTLWYAKDLPSPEDILAQGFAQSTKIYDRTGKILLYQVGQERRTVISVDKLPNHVRFATLAAEDADFYKHPGIDVTGILRAAWNDLRNQKLEQGGSTITQQFVKNALLSSEKTFSRKFREILLSFWLELTYSKDQIFTFYINQIPYGNNAYGIEQASESYFGTSASDLTIAQAALLAALPQRPSYLSPYGDHAGELMARKNMIIDRMVKAGFITESDAKAAKNQPLVFSRATSSFFAPHFVIYVKEYLEEKYGSQLLEKGGLTVTTTLDARLQKEAESAVTQIGKKNVKQFKANNAALVAIDPKTGQILSMVGSRDWFDDSIDGKVNVTLRGRQPGSSFKPFVYATLFEKGFGPESLIFDLPTTFVTRAGKSYTPRNFDGQTQGLLSMRQALGGSRNIPAVKVLALAGIANVIELAQQMGIDTINPSRVDLALVLGGAEVPLLKLTSAYGVLANDGIYNTPRTILRVKKSDGEVLEEFKPNAERVLLPEVTRLVTSILSDNDARSRVFGPSSPLTIPGIQVAAKTGTTTDFRDGWTLGYTPNLVVGVWAGNNDNTPTYKGEGAFLAGPIWNRVVRFAANTYPNEFGGAFLPPLPHKLLDAPMANGSLVYERKVLVDKSTGERATDSTPPSLVDERVYREVHSNLYYYRPDDPQVENWEEPIRQWLASQPDAPAYNKPLPPEGSDGLTNQSPAVIVTSPREGQVVGTLVNVEFTFSGSSSLKQADIFIDDTLVTTIFGSPAQLDLSGFSDGNHAITIRAFDQSLRSSEQTINITLKKVGDGTP